VLVVVKKPSLDQIKQHDVECRHTHDYRISASAQFFICAEADWKLAECSSSKPGGSVFVQVSREVDPNEVLNFFKIYKHTLWVG